MSSPALQSCSQAAGVEPNKIPCQCFTEWESTPDDSVCDWAIGKIQTDLLINSLNRADSKHCFIHESGFAIGVILRSWQNIYSYGVIYIVGENKTNSLSMLPCDLINKKSFATEKLHGFINKESATSPLRNVNWLFKVKLLRIAGSDNLLIKVNSGYLTNSVCDTKIVSQDKLANCWWGSSWLFQPAEQMPHHQSGTSSFESRLSFPTSPC